MEAGGACAHAARLAAAEARAGDLWPSKESLTCFDCGCPGPNLWICLQPDCHHIGCSEVKNDHSTIHQKNMPTHCVHMNVSTERIWCYACEREVHIRAVFSQTKMQMAPETTSIGGASGVARLGFDRAVGLNVSLGDDDEEYVEEPQYGEADMDGRPRGLVGLQNMGNTCYMNAALQALSNTRPFTDYFLDCAPAVMVLAQNKKPGLCRSYQKLVTEMWNKKTRGYVVPNGILYGIRNVHPMFRGYHQHDTQEFLRCFLDRLHEELKEPVRDCNDQLGADAEGDHQDVARKLDIRRRATSSGATEAPSFFPVRRRSPAQSTFSESRADGYLRVHALSESEGQERGVNRHRRSASFAGTQHSQYSHVPVPEPRDVASESDLSCESEAEERYETCSSGGASDAPESRPEPLDRKEASSACGSGDGGGVRYRSVISDVFDGKLLSSVQCLICDRVSTRVETFQDLSLPIPSRDHIAVLRSQQPLTHPPSQSAQDSWMWWLLSWFRSWFYGPVVSLQDCLAAFFSADELKGDNMYSCSRCNKLRNGVKMSGVVRLPEVLCVHLKRFRHELMFSAKVGARVSFPLQDLNMAPYTHKECTSKITRYELCAVICHAGTAGGGHYTCVARNGRSWYEFDDQCVTQVPRQNVAGAEAYVLFYRKVNPQMAVLRQKAAEILEAAGSEPNDMKFYISKQWINKFNTWAEPGAIDNGDFVCSHGGVRPDRVEYVHHLATIIPQALWEFLHDKFGGGPACTHVHECGVCARAAECLRTRRAKELRAFYDLHAIFQEQENPRAIYAISMHWFRQWQAFVRNKTQQPPPPVDNAGIVTKQETPDSTSGPVYILKQGSDHAQLSEELWRFFTDIYGGGPEVKLKSPNIQPEPMYPPTHSLDNHRERLPSFEAKRPPRKHSDSDKDEHCNKATSETNINNIRDDTTLNKNTQSLQNIDRRYRINSSRTSGDSDDEFRYTRNRIRRISHRERNGNYDTDEEMETSPLRMNGLNADKDANDNPLQLKTKAPHVAVTMETSEELPNLDSISLKGKKSGKVRRVKKRW